MVIFLLTVLVIPKLSTHLIIVFRFGTVPRYSETEVNSECAMHLNYRFIVFPQMRRTQIRGKQPYCIIAAIE